MYDYVIVGSGLYGSICAHELNKQGFKVVVVEKRSHVGGNIYTENVDGINVHKYGAHIFHTSNEKVWEYINKFAKFNDFINSPIANYKGEFYHLPFNMNTFCELWKDVKTPEDAQKRIEEEKASCNIKEIKNLEDQAISLVGPTLYEKLVKGYTAKQWGRPCTELPSFIIKRLPVRFTFDNNYFNDKYQGIPIGGYTQIIEKMLEGIEVQLNTNFLDHKDEYLKNTRFVIYTGPIDEYFDYKFGHLEYRSLEFKEETLDIDDYQHNAVINYTDYETPYTRIIEHKHFEFLKGNNKTIITKEYPKTWKIGDEPYYAINDERNNNLYAQYKEEASKLDNVYFGGRLGEYKYYDMDKVILSALTFLGEIE